MSIKVILEQLKKEKDPVKYLEKELKNTSDKEKKKEIEKLIEKEKLKNKKEEKKESSETKARIPSLEQIARSVPRLTAETRTETIEDYHSRSRTRIIVPGLPQQENAAARNQQGYSEEYGSNIKSDYLRTKAEFNKSLESSGLISKAGFTTTAESKHAIQQKAGDKREYMESRDNLNIQQYNVREGMIKEDLVGLNQDLKQAKRGRREIGIYHG